METVNLRNWQLRYDYDNASSELIFYLTGTADRHPKLGTNVTIAFTSKIIDFSIIEEEKKVEFMTLNTKYECEFMYFNIYMEDEVAEIDLNGLSEAELKLAKFSNNCLDFSRYLRQRESDNTLLNMEYEKWLELVSKGALEKTLNKMKEDDEKIANAAKFENCIYMVIETISQGSAVAYHIPECTSVINPVRQDCLNGCSVEYSDRRRNVGMAYHPFGNIVEVYKCTPNIERLIVKNNKAYTVIVETDSVSVEVKPDETMEVPMHS